MEITHEEPHQVVVDGSLHIFGLNHFSNRAYIEFGEILDNISPPNVLALEEYPSKFVLSQLNFAKGDINGEVAVGIHYALEKRISIALIDREWSEIEFQGTTSYQEIIQDAYDESGIEEPEYETAHFRDFSDVDEAIAEYDPEFFREFVAKRNLQMAAYLSWLKQNYEEVLAVVGIGHMEAVLDILQDIDEGKANTKPLKPPIYGPAELNDLIMSDDDVIQSTKQAGSPIPEHLMELFRKQYKNRSSKLLKQ